MLGIPSPVAPTTSHERARARRPSGFNSVNTRYGHIARDMIRREVAGVIRKSVRASGSVVRYGGDEFLAVLAGALELDAERVITREHRVRDWADADRKMYEYKYLRWAGAMAQA